MFLEKFGKYRLIDGSIIYPSKLPNKWLLWIKEEVNSHGIAIGSFVLTKNNFMDFNTVEEAYKYWEATYAHTAT